jgi:hypothetical protein
MTVTTLRSVADTTPAPIRDPLHAQARAQAQSLRHRATSLRTQAIRLGPVLATTYRRRASELELEAFVIGLGADAVVTGAPAA